jgi:hypothetical protein
MLNKIDKYIRKYTKDYNESTNSNYYNLPIGTIRVSNHMAKDSSALFSIIITKNDTYILCTHSNLQFYTISYEDLKKFVKTFALYGYVFNYESITKTNSKLKNEINNIKQENINLKNEIKKINKVKTDNKFLNAYNVYKNLTHEQKLVICAKYGKKDISEFDNHDIISIMKSKIVQKFIEENKTKKHTI